MKGTVSVLLKDQYVKVYFCQMQQNKVQVNIIQKTFIYIFKGSVPGQYVVTKI